MARVPRGIQLGRRTSGGTVRLLDLLLAAGVLAAVVLGFGLRSAVIELGEAAAAPAGTQPAVPSAPDERAGQAAVLLSAGVPDAPVLSDLVRMVLDAAPAGTRITSVEMRSDAAAGFAVALVADAPDSEAVATLLGRLAEGGRVEGASVISETRRRDGGVTTRISLRLTPLA